MCLLGPALLLTFAATHTAVLALAAAPTALIVLIVLKLFSGSDAGLAIRGITAVLSRTAAAIVALIITLLLALLTFLLTLLLAFLPTLILVPLSWPFIYPSALI